MRRCGVAAARGWESVDRSAGVGFARCVRTGASVNFFAAMQALLVNTGMPK